MKKNLHIVKVGGHLVNDSKALDKVLSAFASLDGAKILIHGGGRHATGLAKKLGLTPKMIHGRRITDVDMLDSIHFNTVLIAFLLINASTLLMITSPTPFLRASKPLLNFGTIP